MIENYLDDLKNRYDKPEKAYQAYILEKTLWRNFTVASYANKEVKESFKLQEKINQYCEAIIEKPDTQFSAILNIDMSEMLNHLKDNRDKYEFLNIPRELMINLVSGMYAINLRQASSEITSWDALKNIMNQEKYYDTPEKNPDFGKLAQKYGLESIVIAKASTSFQIIKQIDENFSQLTQVVDCQPHQIGAKRFNVGIDTDEMPYAGQSTQHFTQSQHLYLNSRLMHDAFAHEWLHSMDNILATENNLNYTHASKANLTEINELLIAGLSPNIQAIEKIKKTINTKTLSYTQEIIDRYDSMGVLINVYELKQIVKDVCQKASNGEWNKNKFVKNMNKYTTSDCPFAFIPYLVSEIEIMNHVNNKKIFNKSLFYQYAQNMDKNLVEIGKNEDFSDYSKSRLEIFARMFETYVDNVLKEKKITNTISYIKGSSYTPRPEEMISYKQKWKPVMNQFKEILNNISPPQKELENNSPNKKEIKNFIKGFRNKNFNDCNNDPTSILKK